MIAVFTFDLSDLKASIKNNQWQWYGHCRAEIGGGFSQFNSELSVTNISECDLTGWHFIANFSKQPAALELEQELSTAQKDGTIDAMIITHHPEDKGRSLPKEFLGITIGLRPQKYELFRTFVTLHFGSPNLIGCISCPFRGFADSSQGGFRIPSYSEFLKGRPYFSLDDSSVTVSTNPLP